MSSNDNLDYYRERARRERDVAEAASDPRAAAVHTALAEEYEARVAKGQRPTLRILTPSVQKRWATSRRLSESTTQNLANLN